MGWFDGKTDCYSCGKEVEKKSAEKRFGEYFCSNEEAEVFAKKIEKQREKTKNTGRGCCGK